MFWLGFYFGGLVICMLNIVINHHMGVVSTEKVMRMLILGVLWPVSTPYLLWDYIRNNT